jgi:hypothetical protein
LTGKKNSYVGLLGIDQSVLFLKKGNDIEPSTVIEELDRYGEVEKYNYSHNEAYTRSFSDFTNIDVLFITNIKVEGEVHNCYREIFPSIIHKHF